MSSPLAYLLTWTTYGSWLPGDERGWVKEGEFEIQPPDPERREEARRRMRGEEVRLDETQRKLVEDTIGKHCRIRGWYLHAVNARTNHVHVVVTADIDPERARDQFKAWCTRRLSELEARRAGASGQPRRDWWTEKGSAKWINDEEYLANAIRYVLEGQ
jgi:REP element-mobilizing transposase RayT